MIFGKEAIALEYNLQAGMTNEAEYTVTKKDVTTHIEGFAVLATPVLIGWIEQTALELCQQVLPKGYDTVGCEVNIKHTSPTPVDMTVRVITEITEVNGKLLTYKVKAYDENNKICEGTHVRAVIDVEKFKAKVKGSR